VVAWAIWQYDHGVYAWRERLGKREKKIKSINKSREREKSEIIGRSLFCRPYYFVNNLLLI
jgi:hypothetical protein